MKYGIRIAAWVRPLLLPIGVTRSRAWIQVDDNELRCRFGWYRLTLSRDEIRVVTPSDWPIYGGYGVRMGIGGALGFIGARDGVLQIQLKGPHRTRVLGIPFYIERLFISLDDPDDVARRLRDI